MNRKKFLLAFFFITICCSLCVIGSKQKDYIAVQCNNPVRFYQYDCSVDFDSLKKIYSQNKSFIKDYERQCLIALSFYPDLKECSVDFVYANISTTMACRPSVQSLVRKKREYQIFINDYKDFEGILLQDIPFNAQIGIIGHEIAHVLDYESRNIAGIVQRGINYLTTTAKREYERDIDLLTIEQGLGWQLYDWADFSMYQSTKATEDYKQFKRNTYMSPKEIEEVIKKMDCYRHTIEIK